MWFKDQLIQHLANKSLIQLTALLFWIVSYWQRSSWGQAPCQLKWAHLEDVIYLGLAEFNFFFNCQQLKSMFFFILIFIDWTIQDWVKFGVFVNFYGFSAHSDVRMISLSLLLSLTRAHNGHCRSWGGGGVGKAVLGGAGLVAPGSPVPPASRSAQVPAKAGAELLQSLA